MPRARSRRKTPVTVHNATIPLPPIHTKDQDKRVLSSATNSQPNAKKPKMGKSSTATRARINHFHTLIKEYAKLTTAHQLATPDKARELEDAMRSISNEMTEMGGLDWYQKASLLGQSKQRGGDTSRWLIPQLKKLNMHKAQHKLRLLDVGALTGTNYLRERAWINATPIDLNSQDPSLIHQIDFLDIGLRPGDQLFSEPFDIVSLSLVVNFVGDPLVRGEMLKQAARLLAKDGLLFLVLPLSCIANSRYFDDRRLADLTEYLGFDAVGSHHTNKLAYYLYRFASPRDMTGKEVVFKKKMLHSAPNRNNFSIVV